LLVSALAIIYIGGPEIIRIIEGIFFGIGTIILGIILLWIMALGFF
jgi:hypothetical protein